MRPTRLELVGFGSFREPTTIDFGDADLFALVGPTGAGKSTIIDGVTFALYGSVPRYDDRRLVAPVINQGRVEAKARLDFTVGRQAYTAVRVVRRTTAGATTKEARLQRSDGEHTQVLAGNEKELTEHVERLLGLSFEHFTRCVVLPQGAFAEFLHARPRERQDLLVDLLGISVYRRIASRARDEARQALTRAATLRERLATDLAAATPEALAAAQQRVDALEGLQGQIAAEQPALEHLREEGIRRRAQAEAAAQRRDLLNGLTLPGGVAVLSQRLADAAQARVDASEEIDKAERQRQVAEQERARLPAGEVVRELQRLLREADQQAAAMASAVERLRVAEATHRAAVAAHRSADAALAAALEAIEAARQQNLAHALSAGLVAGDPCPVCERPLDQAPAHAAADLQAAAARHGTAEDAVNANARALQQAVTVLARHQAAYDSAVQVQQQVTERAERLASDHHIQLASLPLIADEVAHADGELLAAQTAERTARGRLRAAEQAEQQLSEQRASAWAQFDTARDRVAELAPPPAQRQELAADWQQLLDWSARQRPVLDDRARTAERAVAQIAEEWRQRTSALVAACQGLAVTVERDPLTACTAALERARAFASQLAHAVQTVAQLRERAATDELLAETATQLGQQLGAKRFEQWLLNQALGQLVVAASARLRDLSSGAYSLHVDDAGNFQVTDHRNADELRSARTLSGGETFLASLALALSLADHVAELATGTSAQLEALFLDEGFGTLDADTLDVVATALEELGASGRTVGLVTHVRELAERMPVRFEVRRAADTSTVERVEQ